MSKPYNEIENVSDQLDGYAEEAAKAIFHIMDRYDVTYNQAAKAVEIAALSQRNDVLQRIGWYLDDISEALRYVSDSLYNSNSYDSVGGSIDRLVLCLQDLIPDDKLSDSEPND